MVALLLQWNWWYWQSPADLLETWRYLSLSSKFFVLVLLTMLTQVLLITATAVAKRVLARSQSRRFVSETKDALQNGRLNDVIATALKFKKSHVAAVVAAGLGAFRELPPSFSSEDARACVERAMNRVSAMNAAEIRLGLSTLRTIAATAPYVGICGTLLGILNSFRGEDSARSALMSIADGVSLALMFAALGLLVAVLAIWAHDWLTKRSNVIVSDVNGAALKIVECVWQRPEWRDRESDIALESMPARDRTAHPWEVAYDRYRLLPLACFVELCGYAVIALMLCSTRTAAPYAFSVGVCLLALGIIALPRLTRNRGTAVAGQDASVAEGFYHPSVERRLRARLPLKSRIAVLPDRSLVFGMPILLSLLMIVFINQSFRVPKGIDVGVAPASALIASQQALVVQVQRGTGTHSYDEQFRIQNKVVPRDELRSRLKAELAGRDRRRVLISGDEDMPFDWVVEVVDLVNGLGGRPVLVGGKQSREGKRRGM